MSRDYNRVIISGRLARDPDVRFTQNKLKTAHVTVAVGRTWKDKASGEKKESVDFTPVVCWSFCAELCEKYLKKGSHILVEGRITTRDYDDVKTGTHKWVTEVVAENIFMLGSKSAESGNGQNTPTPSGGSKYKHDGNNNAGSLRDECGFEEEFPLDFSETNGSGGSGDVEIPF